jgi:hypothetical protein
MYLVFMGLRYPYGETHKPYDQTHGPYGETHALPNLYFVRNWLIKKPFADLRCALPHFLYGMVYGWDTLNQSQH